MGVIETFVSVMASSRDGKDDGEAAHWTFLPLLPVPRGDERSRALVLSELACRVAVPVVLRLVGEPDIARKVKQLGPLWEPRMQIQSDVVFRHRMAQDFFFEVRNQLLGGPSHAVLFHRWLRKKQPNRAAACILNAAAGAAQYPENHWGPRDDIVAKCAADVFLRWSELPGQRQAAWDAAVLSVAAVVALAEVRGYPKSRITC